MVLGVLAQPGVVGLVEQGQVKLLEVTRDKKVTWVLNDWATLGPATAVQVLDEPGVPETPGESEH